MKLADKCIVVTGAAGGIGAALARRFAQENPRLCFDRCLKGRVDKSRRACRGISKVVLQKLKVSLENPANLS